VLQALVQVRLERVLQALVRLVQVQVPVLGQALER